ncbi:MAG TPA: DNA alkylation repair protein [Bryobacteraceae bacterium]|nr:DNA alkylation repair protein [Bryobacteraceae bacterium]
MANIQVLSKRLGRSHELAAELWETHWYEARMLTSFVDEPALVTPEQMDRWCFDFDNWGICDTVCFHLFDRTPYAWDKVGTWSNQNEEFVKRAAFGLLASLAGHDKTACNRTFAESLPLIERAATDERNFVKKGVSWALRRIGRRNHELHSAALPVAQRLADSTNVAARWVGKDALRELTKPSVVRALAKGKQR